jgi:DNA topoisomerase-1
MIKNLVIVESPAKARTIEGFLGKDFIVKSSFGHVRDLSKKKLGVNIENNFQPDYEIDETKVKIVAELKKLSKDAEIVWLATDEDREGEAISWHLAETLKLSDDKIQRIAFHEITKNAIKNAIENPRKINMDLVKAQQARRVLDRLVGFELSPVLWKKVQPKLSAGRVQSVAVRLIVEREEEIRNFKVNDSFKVNAVFITMNNKGKTATIDAELNHKFDTKEDAITFLKKCINADFSITDIDIKPGMRSPAPPFTTSTLQQEASRKLGFSVSRTMMIAQQLYESGKITYMRTDSVNLSDMAIAQAKEKISKEFGDKYVHIRKYKNKIKGAQEAHEAIRPTYISNKDIEGNAAQKKLYDLIWKRTVASQMSDAKLEKTTINIAISNTKEKFVAKGEVIKFDGFLKLYIESSDDENDTDKKTILPEVFVGDKLNNKEILAVQKFTQHPARYTEASLVKKLEELGIGRPSTYAPIIDTIQKRGYVVLEDRKGYERKYISLKLANDAIKEEAKTENTGFEKAKLFPTDIGGVVTNFLIDHFPDVMDYGFTANVEKQFDEIAEGVKIWNQMIKDFYAPFHIMVEKTVESSGKVSGERLLGVDPVSNKNVFAKIGRYGPLVQIGDTESEEKPRFAGLLKNQSVNTISLDEALALFAFPRNVGTYEGHDLIIGIGRFGPYVRHNSLFYSLRKTDDPLTIDATSAIEVINEKRKKDAEKLILSFPEEPDLRVLKGRWGPYIAKAGKNYKLPKNVTPENLTLNDCKKIISDIDAKDVTNTPTKANKYKSSSTSKKIKKKK